MRSTRRSSGYWPAKICLHLMTLTRVGYEKLIELGIVQSDEPIELFGWGYARCEVFDASAGVTSIAAPGARIRVGDLLP